MTEIKEHTEGSSYFYLHLNIQIHKYFYTNMTILDE